MNNKSFIIGLAVIVFILLSLIPFIKKYFDDNSITKFKKDGIPAKAIILSIIDTGGYYNDRPQVKMILEVRPENQEPYETEIKMFISPVYLPQYQPGAHLKVLYDPKNPKKVIVESVDIKIIK